MEATGTNCLACDAPLEADSRRQNTKLYCNDKCRYEGWKQRKEKELKDLIAQIAGRGVRL